MCAMDVKRIEELLIQLRGGALSDADFLSALGGSDGDGALKSPLVARLDDAQVDLDRRRRCGFPEVIFGEGKSASTIAAIAQTLLDKDHDVLATRIDAAQAAALGEQFPEGRYNPVSRTFRIDAATGEGEPRPATGRIAVVTAGTTDLPVAEEAVETARWMGVEVQLFQDVGVAGPHRLLAHVDELRGVDAVVVVAGMEGALPSVVGGHVSCPVIGVPTSVGYGAAFGGLAALLSMLNSCASNVSVVNIDAGFKGAYVAGLIAKNAAAQRGSAE